MKLIRKQPHANTCGAVALVNSIRLMDGKLSYKKAIQLFGGLKSFRNGATGRKIMKVARKLGYQADAYSGSLEDARFFAGCKDFAVIVTYCWIINRNHVGAHAAALDRNGRGINTTPRTRINKQRWKDTKRIWGCLPVIIILRKK